MPRSLLALTAALAACTPGDGPDPEAVAALEAFLEAPDAADVDFEGPDGATAPALLGGRASDIDGHHDMLRAWVDYDDQLHWLFAQADGDTLTWAAVIPPADDGTPTTEPVRAYGDAWNADDPAELLAPIWAEGARYVDPGAEGVGLDGLVGVIADFQDRFPRGEILPDSAVQAQGQLVHFRWRMDATLINMDGMDIGRVDENGQLTLIAGFFGDLQPD